MLDKSHVQDSFAGLQSCYAFKQMAPNIGTFVNEVQSHSQFDLNVYLKRAFKWNCIVKIE